MRDSKAVLEMAHNLDLTMDRKGAAVEVGQHSGGSWLVNLRFDDRDSLAATTDVQTIDMAAAAMAWRMESPASSRWQPTQIYNNSTTPNYRLLTRLGANEMSCKRSIKGVSRRDRIRNVNIREEVGGRVDVVKRIL